MYKLKHRVRAYTYTKKVEMMRR